MDNARSGIRLTEELFMQQKRDLMELTVMYTAGTLSRGENGWNFDPGKDFGKDYCTWNWGGSIVVHQLVQHDDGNAGL